MDDMRKEEIQRSLKKAADPPLFTAATSLKILKLCQQVVEKGNPNTVNDAAVGIPGLYDLFYRNNTGAATLTITRK